MTNQQILKKSLTITTTQTGLWTLGIFLSSGFNLHWWYLLTWLKQTGIIDLLVDKFTTHQVSILNQLWLFLGAGLLFGIFLIMFNVIKLWFFGKVHQNLHSERLQKCFLCKRLKDDNQNEPPTIFKLIWRRSVLWRTCLASLITIGSTVVTFTGFRYLLSQNDYISGQAIILAICLGIILVGISLWNMLVVLYIFWYELSFPKATNLAIDTLFSKVRKIMGLTLILTIIFLLAVSAGSVVIWQLPNLFSALPEIISGGKLVHSAQTIISSLAALLFLAWLVLNNVFFNVAMLILFDQLLNVQIGKAIIDGEVSMPAKPVMLHHSRLPIQNGK